MDIKLDELGKLQSTHELLFNFDMGGLLYMEYEDFALNIKIYLSKKENENDDKNIYICDMRNKNSISSFHIFDSDIDLDRIIHYRNYDKLPVLYNYDNAEEKQNDMFILRFTINNRDIKMSFYKDKCVFKTSDTSCTVYKNDDVINSQNLLEIYHFSSNGFVCLNNKNNVVTMCSNDTVADFKLFKKKNFNFNYHIFDSLPTSVEYSNGNKYQYYYDNLGIVSNCIDLSNPKRRLCRYESIERDGDYGTIYSIHPLMYDTFKFSNFNIPLKYWAEDILDFSNDLFTIKRNIYTVEPDNVEKIIKRINWE